jgi:hypothetical protein
VTATPKVSPAAKLTTLASGAPSARRTAAGVGLGAPVSDPVPSWPRSSPPHARIPPSAVSASQCRPPAETALSCTLESPGTSTGEAIKPGWQVSQLGVIVVPPAHHRTRAGDRECVHHGRGQGHASSPERDRDHVLQPDDGSCQRARDDRVVAKLAKGVSPRPDRPVLTQRHTSHASGGDRDDPRERSARREHPDGVGSRRGRAIAEPSGFVGAPCAHTLPSDFGASACVAPAEIATTSVKGDRSACNTGTGLSGEIVVPSPI